MRLMKVIKRHPVLSYCVFVILWSFSWWTLILTVVPVGTAFDLPMHRAAVLLMVVGLAGPLLVALSLTRLIDGKGSVGSLLSRLKHWRVGWWWLALLIPYVLNMVLYVEYAQVQGGVDQAQIPARIGPAIGIGLTAGLFEEIGWRGFLLPRLQQRYRPLVAALLVGLFWGGVWHLYGDYIGGLGNRGWWSIPLILVQAPVLLIAMAVLLGWIYNRTNGSLLLCVLFHASISSSSLLLSVSYPSSAAYFVWAVIGALLWWAVVCAVLLLDRRWWASLAAQRARSMSASPPARPLAAAD